MKITNLKNMNDKPNTSEKALIYKEVTLSVIMSKSICLEVPEDFTNEEIERLAEREIMTPDMIMKVSEDLFKHFNINVSNLDFKGWNVDKIESIVE